MVSRRDAVREPDLLPIWNIGECVNIIGNVNLKSRYGLTRSIYDNEAVLLPYGNYTGKHNK